MYQCGFCKAEYGRPDHLVRHVRGHTKQRPFTCTVCGKGFARQDLLKRHASTHNDDYAVAGTSNAEEAAMMAQLRRYSHRVHSACRSCAARKVKCTDQKPCKRCQDSGIACEYDEEGDPGSPPAPDHDRNHESTTISDPQGQGSAGQSSLTLVEHPPTPSEVDRDLNNGNAEFAPLLQDDDDGIAVENYHCSIIADVQPADQNDVMMQDILGSTLTLPDFGDFIEIDDPALPMLDDLDLSFLNYTAINSAQPSPADLPPMYPPSESTPHSSSTTTGVVAAAYRKSHVHRGWEPDRDENQELEHQNLVLPHNMRAEYLTHSSSENTLIAKKPLSLSMRDRILAMILRTASPPAAERTVASFPPLEVLRDLIHLAFVRMRDLLAVPIIHIPSLDLNEQRPELLAALIAFGSVFSPSASVRKFGYAIQEMVRIAINQLVEQQHATLREQDVCQAFYLQLHLAYYSGISRKIEMAEGTSMLGTTVLRRGKMLQGQNYAPPADFLAVPGLSIQQKWLKWVAQESRKRLVYFAFTLDAHVSASRNIAVLFPYSEIETPLPVANRLWEAESATKWWDLLQHDIVLRTQQPPSLNSIMRSACLSTSQRRSADATCTAVALLSGFWALVHEYQQMNIVSPPAQRWTDFVLNSRYSELSTKLDQVRTEIVGDLIDVRPEVLLLQESMGLHLNASFYELSKYAGIGTEEDARLAVTYAQRWFESPQSRAALWHAGQIFRAAKLLPARSLSDVYVIALYHAAVTLWVWGMLHRTQAGGPTAHTDTNLISQRVALDGDESPAVSRYLKSSRTLPGLTSSSGDFVALDDLTAAPDLANEIVMENWGMEPLPLTAEEVSRLMQGFSRICRQRFQAVGA